MRHWAELALEIEGPTTEFYNAGRSKPLTLELEVKNFTYQGRVTETRFGFILAKIGIPRRFFPQRWIFNITPLCHVPLIYFQVLGMAKDTRSVAAIRPFYEKYKKIVDTEPVTA